MHRTMIFPAVFISCLIVIWVGTVAAAHMPANAQQMESQITTDEALSNDDAASAEGASASAPSQDNQAPLTCAISMNYPEKIQQWCEIITAAAQNTGLPANLIAAVILQESGGKPAVLSHSGAVGLMQVMPRDGVATEFMCVNGPCFTNRPSIAELKDPAFTVNYGSGMLANLFAKHGSYREALFRYGPIDMGYVYADKVLTIWETY